jgi:hypothetical protein
MLNPTLVSLKAKSDQSIPVKYLLSIYLKAHNLKHSNLQFLSLHLNFSVNKKVK